MIKEHTQFNLERKTPEVNGGDFVSAPNTARTDKDLIVKDFFNVNNTETQQLHGQKVKAKILPSGTSATYNALLNDYIVGFKDVVVSRTIKLPKPSLAGFGKIYIVKDFSGSASATTITISPFDGEYIDSDTASGIGTDYGVKRLVTDGTNWFTI